MNHHSHLSKAITPMIPPTTIKASPTANPDTRPAEILSSVNPGVRLRESGTSESK